MHTALKRTAHRLVDALEARSPALAARVDWNTKSLWPWNGPMNGQPGRQAIVRELVRVFDPTVVIETGTHRGASTGFLFDVAGVPVISSETSERSHWYASRRYLKHAGIEVRHSDSRDLLREIASCDTYDLTRPFLYLDAHWHDDVPLAGELAIIDELFDGAIVMIDDFEVPGDSGYGYDDYGSRGQLSVSSFERHFPSACVPLFPSLPSADEQPPRRGCVVLAPADWVDAQRGSLVTLTLPDGERPPVPGDAEPHSSEPGVDGPA